MKVTKNDVARAIIEETRVYLSVESRDWLVDAVWSLFHNPDYIMVIDPPEAEPPELAVLAADANRPVFRCPKSYEQWLERDYQRVSRMYGWRIAPTQIGTVVWVEGRQSDPTWTRRVAAEVHRIDDRFIVLGPVQS